jgi:hypothetical protein
MIEDEWLGSGDLRTMLEFMQASGKTSDRKFRLFACACCRRIWDRFPDPCNRDLVAAVEDQPNGSFDDPVLHTIICASSAREHEFSGVPAYWVAKYLGRGFYKVTAAGSAEIVAVKARRVATGNSEDEAEEATQAALLRDLLGPLPFRPVPIDPAWLTWNDSTVRRLAAAVYQERELPSGHLDLTRLAVLADALEDAGCAEALLLEHLRGPGPHVRGCWAVDLLLVKG